ncbi:hypothetical protein J3R74_003295 [Puniceicoccus vermicola]
MFAYRVASDTRVHPRPTHSFNPSEGPNILANRNELGSTLEKLFTILTNSPKLSQTPNTSRPFRIS